MKKTAKSKKKHTSGKVFPYTITYEQLEKYNGKDHDQIYSLVEELFSLSTRSPKKAIIKLNKAIEQFPYVAEFYNYLSTATVLVYGMEEKTLRTIKLTLEKFPDYLFGRLNLAHYLLYHGEVEKISEVFNNNFDLKKLYPQRDVFHISEVRAFLNFMVLYYAELNNFGAAKKYFMQLESIDPDDPYLEKLEDTVIQIKFKHEAKHILESVLF